MLQLAWKRLVGSLLVAGACAAVACSGDEAKNRAPTTVPTDAGAAPLCVDGNPVDWPPPPYELSITSTVPPGIAFDAIGGAVRLKDFFEPCAPRSRLLVVRMSAAWCGTCIWHAEHTKRLLEDPRFEGRLVLLDVLVGDEDNMPPSETAAARWQQRIDLPTTRVARDPKYTFAPALLSRGALPSYILIDTRKMTIEGTEANPAPEVLQNDIALTLAQLDGQPRPELASPASYDGFTEDEVALLQGMKLPAAPPPDPTNEFADVPAAASFGKILFEDAALSPAGVSCSKCHDATKDFNDAVPQSIGVSKVDRNSPAIALAAHARWQFWDGSADTLWMQALGPPENSVEMASNRLYIAHQVAARHAATYSSVFAAKYPLPDLSDTARFPANGKPGDAAWEAMAAEDRDAVTRIYVNVGKAIAAFERSLRVRPNALDRYADGDTEALTKTQKLALKQFFINGCAQCHWGPRLTDDAFHVLRFPTGRQDGKPDRGRIDAFAKLSAAEFLASSKWSDAPQSARVFALEPVPSMLGAFKTPPLRGVARSGPYGHGGTFATLLDVSKHYGTRGDAVKDDRAVGDVEEWVPLFDANVQAQLPELLELLTADIESP